jgi:hypothetical protein
MFKSKRSVFYHDKTNHKYKEEFKASSNSKLKNQHNSSPIQLKTKNLTSLKAVTKKIYPINNSLKTERSLKLVKSSSFNWTKIAQ